jgi:ATPase subunit of ABC transporter with duplicated ATPase domains
VLHTYIKNIVDNPTEEKFRSINMENKAYKAKVKPFIGGKSLLLALGFNQNPSGDVLILTEPDFDLLRNTRSKLEAALTSYGS